MQRYFVPAENWYENEVAISGDDAHHISRVMRYKEGSMIICNHPDGRAAKCVVTSVGQGDVTVHVDEWLNEDSELPVNVTIAQGMPKSDKIEYVLQKGTELGASAFIPYQAERSVVFWDAKKTQKKITRLSKILKEASEQSHRNSIPDLKPVMGIKELIEESKQYDVKIFAYEEEAKVSEHQSFGKLVNSIKAGQNVLVCIGPEGGFSANEVETFKENDFSSVRLGPRILRTETAPLYVLASISYHFEELRCR
ncbi:16S rRNA (uracil(1498)-N(3))-methyltransferase [Virgibacillus oceani]|uniref:Ribosomal RNA small subunit methyltransferase E n=1 Tax=Virgibacillus oceani TaxID=1479511 RepID=A0A917H093_9BACI|nr:16S rRNA (uracil(1498)-N(3))-methyltransferase [Virgibacillus oceani]GGG63312.1 ribosomal RNA small subunit methyltransferase E [Virgibacillus oceani]